MKFFEKIVNFVNSVNKFEASVSNTKATYLEVYEKNLRLEKEILERTNELEKANKTFVTLQNVWDMMNSDKPLSSVLSSIAEGLKGEFGYIHSSILRLECDKFENKKYLVSRAISKSKFAQKLSRSFAINIGYNKFRNVKNGYIDQALTNNEVVHTTKCVDFFSQILPSIPINVLESFFKTSDVESIIIVPIMPNQEQEGILLVYSSRDDIKQNEINFLKLFAHQIEQAIVIAGLFEKVKKQAVTDPLTELYNRRYFEESLYREIDRSKRQNQPFSIISIDLDYLKKINDKYGHQFGDLAIQTISKVLKQNARSVDIPSRFGGEEFNILLPGINSVGAKLAAERIRVAIANEKINTIGQITASIGVVTFLEHTDNPDELLELADQAMYKAKLNGRNQVCVSKSKMHSNWQEIALKAFLDILSSKKMPLPDALTKSLTNTLNKTLIEGKNTNETLYGVVDSLIQTYNYNHLNGETQKKVQTALNFAKFLELQKEDIDDLKIALLLYDIGNIMVPEEIFNKPQILTYEEKLKIQKHPLIATKQLLEPLGEKISEIMPIIENHHENWDGSGYPYKKSGQAIPITSQIILIVDAYFALINNRPYRDAYSKEEALKILKNEANKKWNSQLVDKFLYMIENEQQ